MHVRLLLAFPININYYNKLKTRVSSILISIVFLVPFGLPTFTDLGLGLD